MLRYADIRLDASTIKELPDGSIKLTGQLTHPGIFDYRNPDGSRRREYRPADEVFNKAALETFAGVAVTIGHPRMPNGARLVNTQTRKNVAIGHIGDNVREDGGHMVADIYVTDANAIAKVRARKLMHISCGYNVDYDATPGTTPGGDRYDGVQRNIRGNHVALLPEGEAPRGGAECVLRLDSNGDELKLYVDLEAQIAALKSELDKARADAADLPNVRKALADAQAQIAALSEQLTPARLDSLIEARASVVALAKAEGIDSTGKSALQVKRAIVAKRTPVLAARVDNMSEDAIDGCMAVYASQPAAPSASQQKVAEVLAPPAPAPRTDSDARTDGVPKVDDIHAKFVTESRNAWKNSGDKVN